MQTELLVSRCILWFEVTESATRVQTECLMERHKRPPMRPSVCLWHKIFCDTGCSVCHTKKPGRPFPGSDQGDFHVKSMQHTFNFGLPLTCSTLVTSMEESAGISTHVSQIGCPGHFDPPI
jgi:hypothetical protein